MPTPITVTFAWAPLAVAIALSVAAPAAHALSKRDQDAVDAINQRTAAAEQRYRDALVKVKNGDQTGVQDSNAAIEDIEDAVQACAKQKGCAVTEQISAYKRLLKLDVDMAAARVVDGDADPDGDPMDPDPDRAGDLAAAVGGTTAANVPTSSLLDPHNHRFISTVQFNPAVQAGIRRWLTDLRPSLMASYENYQYLRPQMAPAFERAGLPEALLFGIMAKESNGKVHVSSRAGAAGPMQFMPATGQRFGLGNDGTGFDTRFDPLAVGEASAQYLNERMAELNGNIELALAAYNGGEGRALRVYQTTGGRSFWDADVYAQFPVETRDYVPMVIAAAWLFLHPKKYGLNFPKVDNKPTALRLEKPTSIYALTICLGSGRTREGFMRTLRNLNPRYQPDSWLPAGGSITVTTQMEGLYRRYCVSGPRAELAQQLMVVDASTAIVSTGPLTPLPATPMTVPGQGVVPVTVATGRPTAAKKPRAHRVARGETLVEIAHKYSCDTKSLAKINGIKGPRYAIKPGQTLKVSSCQ